MGRTRTFAAGRVRTHSSLNLTWQTGKEHSIGSQFQEPFAREFGRPQLPGVVEDSAQELPEVEHRVARSDLTGTEQCPKTRNSSLEPVLASGTLSIEKEWA